MRAHTNTTRARSRARGITLRGQKQLVHAERRVITWNTYLNKEEEGGAVGRRKKRDGGREWFGERNNALNSEENINRAWRQFSRAYANSIQNTAVGGDWCGGVNPCLCVGAIFISFFSCTQSQAPLETELSMMRITVHDGSGGNNSLWEHFAGYFILQSDDFL